MNAPRRIRMMRPTSADHFPAIELEAVAPCLLDDDDRVIVPGPVTGTYGSRIWAEQLSEEIKDQAYSVRALDGSPWWTHHLRLQTRGGSFRDFVVRASGLPDTEFEAHQHGLGWVEFELAIRPPAKPLVGPPEAGG